LIGNRKKEPFSYDVVREGEDIILKIDCEAYYHIPSIEDDGITMGKVMDLLIEVGNATKIVLSQKRNYEYDYGQTTLMVEMAKLYKGIMKGDDFSYNKLIYDRGCVKCVNTWYSEIKHIFTSLFKSDPIGAYVELKRVAIREKAKHMVLTDDRCSKCVGNFFSVISKLVGLMENTKLISLVKGELAGHKVGDRNLYRRIFSPSIKPDFMFTKLMSTFPANGEELDSYTIADDTEITIFELPETIQYLYHMVPPEFMLSEDEYEVLDNARKIMADHKPKKSEFVNPERMREVFHNVGRDLMGELTDMKRMKLSSKKIDKLTNILVRYTVGFGLIEVLLQDEKVQDVTINSPMGEIPMFIIHQDYDACKTNIIPTKSESESWASKLRMVSGRPLDEANPILDTELIIPGAKTRVGVISEPLNPSGIAYAFRRHRDKPWTLPLFIKNRMINALGAGLISFLVDGSRTMLVAGTRSAGKSSLLGSVLTEIMRKYRIITIEDTLELPVGPLRDLGYNIQPMKVASAMSKGSSEVPADEGIRTTLRLGDSCLIVGEVRSTEAAALYEAMRVGALANVVAGTIHGDSPYGVFDRVVNDLKVPRTSFKATDIIVVANPIRSADGLHRWRRVTQITEVRKQWEQDPMLENGFVDLMKYDSITDELQPSDDLINGDSEILKSIAGSVKEWAGNWDAVWDNVLLKAKIKGELVKFSDKTKRPDLLEAPFVISSNDEYHRISNRVKEEVGSLDSKRIFFSWNEWMKRTVKKMDIR